MTFWDLWAPKPYPKSCHPLLQISASPGQRSSTCLPSPEQVTVQPGLQATSPIPALPVPHSWLHAGEIGLLCGI